jgi:hypothetical protein
MKISFRSKILIQVNIFFLKIANGTYINGTELSKQTPTALNLGSKLTLGECSNFLVIRESKSRNNKERPRSRSKGDTRDKRISKDEKISKIKKSEEKERKHDDGRKDKEKERERERSVKKDRKDEKERIKEKER